MEQESTGDSVLNSHISSVLPNLTTCVLDSVLDTLKNLGVETLDDFRFVKDDDLLMVLKPIEVRKLLASFTVTCETTISSSPCSSRTETSTISSPGCSFAQSCIELDESLSPLEADWFLRFEIPWEKLPTDLLYKLERQERPSPKQRREMIRLIINEVTGVCKRPSKKHLTDIARRIVAEYPKSLQDVIEGHIVGSGYDSLVKQLQSRADNVKRTQFSTPKRQFQHSSGSDTEEVPAKERALPQDTYGCINWDPEHLPITETLASQKQQQEEMKTMFRERNWDTQIITKKMMATYYTQRKDIIRGDSLLTASRLMLSIDKVVVTEQQTNFVEALLMMFASYYCLNIHYPSELGATLEFLQRCIFKINPDKGMKVERKPHKRQYAVNPRVLSLISAIADFEWRE
ncbi:hypothetical protein HHUSO_G36549 [Huso huso]|uniref:Uncharacterized protein n=1 Tax=Huso huso TaxID=61971 RepID=A0ABR0Y1J9_HUSHU